MYSCLSTHLATLPSTLLQVTSLRPPQRFGGSFFCREMPRQLAVVSVTITCTRWVSCQASSWFCRKGIVTKANQHGCFQTWIHSAMLAEVCRTLKGEQASTIDSLFHSLLIQEAMQPEERSKC